MPALMGPNAGYAAHSSYDGIVSPPRKRFLPNHRGSAYQPSPAGPPMRFNDNARYNPRFWDGMPAPGEGENYQFFAGLEPRMLDFTAEMNDACTSPAIPDKPLTEVTEKGVVYVEKITYKNFKVFWTPPENWKELSLYRIEVKKDEEVPIYKELSVTGGLCTALLETTRQVYGESLVVRVIGITADKTEQLIGSTSVECVFTMQDMEVLMRKAEDFVSSQNKTLLSVVYRTKDPIYFDKIKKRNNNIMYPEKKDNNGHACSPINGRLSGLFFSARVFRDGRIPKISPFGCKRYHLRPDVLLNNDEFDHFFADFYCHDFRKQHYVTIVVSPKKSKTAESLESVLPKLDIKNNAFLQVTFPDDNNNNGAPYYHVSTNVYVEIYFTKEIDLNKAGYFRLVSNIGTPIPWSGREQDSRCSVCTL